MYLSEVSAEWISEWISSEKTVDKAKEIVYIPIFDSLNARKLRDSKDSSHFQSIKSVAIYYYFFFVSRMTFFMLVSVRIS